MFTDLTAAEALALSKEWSMTGDVNKAMNEIMVSIRSAASRGDKRVSFELALADRPVLQKVEEHLVTAGYVVSRAFRSTHTLIIIDWSTAK